MASILQIQLLGDFRLTYGDQPVTSVDSPRLQSLLAYLLLHSNAPQPRQRLAFLLFPDSTESQARTNLRTLLHRLRAALPEADNFLGMDSQHIWWRPDAPFTLDVSEFEEAIAQAERIDKRVDFTMLLTALERATAIYQGNLLPDCFDDWITPERERLHRLVLEALERLIKGYEQQRAYTKAINYARHLLNLEPVHEPAYLALMRLYAVSGDRSAALHTYHTCTTIFRQELDAEPGPAISEAYTQLLAASTSESISIPTQTPLVGREAEWQHLRTVWTRAASGQPRLLIISGEAGIGKTRLAEELLTWVRRQGADVAVAHCYATENDLAYAPIIAWLRDPDVARHRKRLERTWLGELIRLLPETRVEYPDLIEPLALQAGWQRQRLFEALARAMLAGGRPLLLFIDDLQWCDRDTLEWIHYLLRFDPKARLMVLGTARSEELADNAMLLSLLDDLRHADRLSEIALGTLSRRETVGLAQHLIGHELDVSYGERLYAETEGTPLFIVETVRAGITSGDVPQAPEFSDAPRQVMLPPKVQALIARRFSHLSAETREILYTAAVIGRSFTFQVLARATQVGEESLVRGVDELWQRRIVRESGADGYDFTHDKLRELGYASLSAARRRLLHRRVAEALEASYAANLDPITGQLASHYERAGLNERAISAYRRAAEVARRLYANADAVDYCRRALMLLQTDWIVSEQQRRIAAEIGTQLGDLLHLMGRYDEAGTAYQDALSSLNHTDSITRAHLQRKLGNCWRELHHYDEALSAYQAAEVALEGEDSLSDPSRRQAWSEIQLDRINVYYWLANLHALQHNIERLQPIVEQYGMPHELARFYQILAMATLRIGRYLPSDEAVTYARAFLAALSGSGDSFWLPSAHFQLGFVLLWHRDLDNAECEMLEALELAEQRGDVLLQARCLTYLTVVYRWGNQADKVQTYAERSLLLATSNQMYDYIGAAHGNVAWLRWRKHDVRQAKEQGRLALEAWKQLPNAFMFQWIGLWPLIGATLNLGELDQALGFTRKLLEESQQRMPPMLEAALESALQAAGHAEFDTARLHLEHAIRCALDLNFL